MIKPNVRDVIARNDLVFARVRRTRIVEEEGKRKKIKISKIYAFDRENGEIRWTYPKKNSLKGVRSSTLKVSDDGQFVSWSSFDWDKGINPLIKVFRASDGEILWQYQCDTIEKYFKASSSYSGISFSPDSNYASIILNDGRIIIINNKKSIQEKTGVVENIINLTTPIEAGTVPVMTYMTRNNFTKENNLIILTGHTYTTPFADTKKPPLHHPNANSIFALNISGELLWRFTAGGNPSMFDLRSANGKEYLTVSFAHNVRTQDLNEHGFYLFDLNEPGGSFSKLKAFYHTDGICVDAKLSPDLSQAYAIEAVIDMDDGMESFEEFEEGETIALLPCFCKFHTST
jgi:hypothetical protein